MLVYNSYKDSFGGEEEALPTPEVPKPELEHLICPLTFFPGVLQPYKAYV